MDDIGAKEDVTKLLASQDAQTLAQTLLELAEDYAPVDQRLERLRLQSDPAALTAQFTQRLKRWDNNERYVLYQDAGAFGRELDMWVAQVQREMLPRFPAEAMKLFAAFMELDTLVFEHVDDDGGHVGGAFELACDLWCAAAQATGFTAGEIADRASALLAADHYGARARLEKALNR